MFWHRLFVIYSYIVVVEPRVVRRFGLRERHLPLICIIEGVRDPLKGCLESEGHSVLHNELIGVLYQIFMMYDLLKISALGE